MEHPSAEYRIIRNAKYSILSIRKQNRDLGRYFPGFAEDDPLTGEALESLIREAEEAAGATLQFREKEIGSEIRLRTEESDERTLQAFAGAFLDALGSFYEKNEVHVTRMFGSFVYLKRIDGILQAVRATPVPLRHCPLMKQLLMEVGGEDAGRLLAALDSGDIASQPEMMRRLISEVVIKGGYFDTSRPLNSCEANVLFGASETISSAFKSGLVDAAVIVSNNLGTIITTNEGGTQGAVKRMTGLFLTSPSKELVKTARGAGIIPVFPHTAIIDQLEGVRLAAALGYKRIAVSVAWMDNILLGDISSLEKDGVTLYKFGLCSTGIDDRAAEAMARHADLVWSCASKAVRTRIVPNAVAQVGVKIPVYIMTGNGWALVKNHLEVTAQAREGGRVSYDNVVCRKGGERPVILNDGNSFAVITAKDLQECADCPHPCV